MATPEVERLRAEVRRRRAAATKKISRVRREDSVRIAGSQYDPRRALGVESKYTAKQLRAYLNLLNGFTHRSTQFVAGSAGAPIPRARWKRFEDVQRRFNASRDWHGRKIDNTMIPGRNETYRQAREKAKQPAFPSESLLGRASLSPKNFANEKGLDKIERSLRRRATPQGMKDDIRKARFNLDKIASFAPDGGRLQSEFDQMTDTQVVALWSDRFFMDSLSTYVDSERGQYEQDTPEMVIDNEMQATWARVRAVKAAF